VGIAVTNLHDADAVQLPLPFDRRSRAALDAALDTVKDRFGTSAVTRGVLLGRRNPASPCPDQNHYRRSISTP